jgi:multiple sugar transport system permease protein
VDQPIPVPPLSEPVTRPTHPWRRSRLKRGLLYLIATALGLMFMFPFAWTVASSLKQPRELFIFPPSFFPEKAQLENYITIFRDFPFDRWYLNSFIIVTLNTAGVLVTASLVAYGFARFNFRFRNILFILVIATMMMPPQITLIPRFILFDKLGWLNTLLPLWVPAWFGGTPFAIFLMRQFMLTLPKDLDEAAILDGASYVRVFWEILVPLCKPALATLAIINFIAVWNEFLDPVIFISSVNKFPVAVGLWYFQAQPMSTTPTAHLLLAASVTTIIPPIILFFAFQRYFVRGVALTGLKG